MSARVPVTFAPGGRTVWVEPGEIVLNAARRAGVLIPAPCGGRGICGGCGVRVLEGELAAPDEQEARGFAFAPSGVRLGCRARIVGPVTLRPVVAPPAVRPESPGGASVTGRRLVAAVDLGTTTVAGVVIDEASGAELGRGVVPNHQAAWGSDVLSRIEAASDGHAEELRAAAEAAVLEALAEACERGATCIASIGRLVVAANTAMAALLLGVDVSPLAAHPFALPISGSTALRRGNPVLDALAEDAVLLVLPPIAGFIGGDVTAGLVATGMIATSLPRLFVDLGTNAEIVCSTPGGLIAASAAAGPAFEGFGIRSGGPAAPGAVERVEYADGSLRLRVIGGGPAEWLCGSGLVSAIAELRRLGHIDDDGLLQPEGPLEPSFGAPEGVAQVTLAGEGIDPRGVTLTQHDIRAFQLAKGAVLAAVLTVMEESGVGAGELTDVAIAGAFGAALEVADLVDLGVIPAGLAGKVRIVGNASLSGAAMIALDSALMEAAEGIVANTRRLELAGDDRFTGRFMGSLALARVEGA